ncbi:MAG TPA: tetratricopeptide repeat protein [Spirochaetota bacterium]|nr:tetratricopeptide repeat protein [Spirochaetota bacterium]
MMLKKYRGEIILAAISAFSVIIMLLLNYGNSRLRFAEIKKIMAESVSTSQDIDHAGLIVQYRFRMDLYRKELTESEADLIEMKAASMFPELPATDNLMAEGITIRISALIVNTFKSLMGKPQFFLNRANPGNIALGTAYYYERNSLFIKALEQYEEALKYESRSRQRGGILLHQGFCFSMAGNTTDAIKKYSTVIELYPDDPVSVTASLLLEYLQKFSDEADNVKKMPDSPEKMEKLFRLIAFNDSLKVLENMDKNQKPERNIIMQFYKARCLESTGRVSEALTLYQNILMEKPSSEQAGYANKRILMISLKSNLRDESKKLVENNNSIIGDKSLQYFIDEIGKIESLLVKNRKLDINNHQSEVKSVLLDCEKRAASFNQFLGKNMKITTISGDVIIGPVIYEDDLKIKVSTIAGEAVIMKNAIKKSEFR